MNMKKKYFLLVLVIFIITISLSISTNATEDIEQNRGKEYNEIAESDEKGVYVIIPEKDETGKYVVKSDEKTLIPYDSLENNIKDNVEKTVENNINNNTTASNSEISLMAATPAGSLDVVNSDVISGWAWRSDVPNSAIDVHIYLYDDLTGKQYGPYPVRADVYREDLKNAGIGNGCHCFNYQIN